MPLPVAVNTQWIYQVVAVGVEGTLTQTVSEARREKEGWEVVLTTRARIGAGEGERVIATERYVVSAEALVRLTGFGGTLNPPLLLWRNDGEPKEKEWRGQLILNGEKRELSAIVHYLGKERISGQGKTQEAEKIHIIWAGMPFAFEQTYWLVPGTGFVKFLVDTPAGRVTAVLREVQMPEGL